jgi:hypothetical protein
MQAAKRRKLLNSFRPFRAWTDAVERLRGAAPHAIASALSGLANPQKSAASAFPNQQINK